MSLTDPANDPGGTEQSDLQLDDQGRLRHLLTLRGMERGLITAILDQAESYLSRPGDAPVRGDALSGNSISRQLPAWPRNQQEAQARYKACCWQSKQCRRRGDTANRLSPSLAKPY